MCWVQIQAAGLPTTAPNVVSPYQAREFILTIHQLGTFHGGSQSGFTTDPTPIAYILTETLTGLTGCGSCCSCYTEIPPVANNDALP
ncbi:MAG: hypothetical protein IPP37_07100 [Saprospiraceae bacterium]|nr:hypothetical protein [Saprospiraceae bacterium]